MCLLQYPLWLSNNKGKIDDEQYTKYEQQFQLMSTITKEFEEEEPSDSNDVKRRRFERILDMMQRMQEFGHPPKEIVGDMVRWHPENLTIFLLDRRVSVPL